MARARRPATTARVTVGRGAWQHSEGSGIVPRGGGAGKRLSSPSSNRTGGRQTLAPRASAPAPQVPRGGVDAQRLGLDRVPAARGLGIPFAALLLLDRFHQSEPLPDDKIHLPQNLPPPARQLVAHRLQGSE